MGGSTTGEKHPRLDVLADVGKLFLAASGLLGAAIYVLLSIACTVVYAPLGISPDDVGLGYAALLARTAVGVSAVVAVYVLAAGGALLVGWAIGVSYGRAGRWGDRLLIAAFVASLATTFLVGGWLWVFVAAGSWLLVAMMSFLKAVAVPAFGEGRRQWVLAACIALITMSGVIGAVVFAAQDGADDLREGRRPSHLAFALPPPWDAQVVRVAWLSSPPPRQPRLPVCMLYLGEASGTSVFYDATPLRRRALRIPTSSIVVEVLREARSALPKPRGQAGSKKSRGGPCTPRHRADRELVESGRS